MKIDQRLIKGLIARYLSFSPGVFAYRLMIVHLGLAYLDQSDAHPRAWCVADKYKAHRFWRDDQPDSSVASEVDKVLILMLIYLLHRLDTKKYVVVNSM